MSCMIWALVTSPTSSLPRSLISSRHPGSLVPCAQQMQCHIRAFDLLLFLQIFMCLAQSLPNLASSENSSLIILSQKVSTSPWLHLFPLTLLFLHWHLSPSGIRYSFDYSYPKPLTTMWPPWGLSLASRTISATQNSLFLSRLIHQSMNNLGGCSATFQIIFKTGLSFFLFFSNVGIKSFGLIPWLLAFLSLAAKEKLRHPRSSLDTSQGFGWLWFWEYF